MTESIAVKRSGPLRGARMLLSDFLRNRWVPIRNSASLLIALPAFLFAPLPAISAVSVQATVDRTTAAVNQPFVMTVNVSGAGSNVPQPEWPPGSYFDVYAAGTAQNVSIVNGAVSSSVTFQYNLVPKAAGTLIIPPLTIRCEGKTYNTNPITVAVTNAPAPAAPQAAPGGAPAANPEKQIFVAGEASRKRAYVGEQVTYTFRLYRRVQLLSRPGLQPPDFSGFVAEDMRPREFQVPRNGVGYMVSELKYALFPISPGTQTIGPATLQVSVADLSNPDPFAMFFQGGRNLILKTDPIQITVMPLPADGRPAGFSGAVGSYRALASLDRTVVEAGRPVTLTLQIEGRGLVKSLKEPDWPEMPSVRRYETLSSLNINNSGEAIEGSKTFKVILIPQSAGKITIPPVPYPVFDPASRKYVILKTAPLALTVKPGAVPAPGPQVAGSVAPEGIKEVHRDIRFLKGAFRKRPFGLPAPPPAVFWTLSAVPGLFFLSGIAAAWRKRALNADPSGARARRARRAAEIRLTRARDKAGDTVRFHSATHDSLVNYLADKWGVSPSGLTIMETQRRLEGKGAPEDLVVRVRALWEEADLIRYAPSAAASADPESQVAAIRALLDELEKIL